MHTTFHVIDQINKFGHAPWIDTPAGSKFFDAAPHAQRRRNLLRYRSTNVRRSAWDRSSTGRIWERGWDARRLWSPKKFPLQGQFFPLLARSLFAEGKGGHAWKSGGMGGGEWASVAIEGRMGGGAPLLFYLHPCFYC